MVLPRLQLLPVPRLPMHYPWHLQWWCPQVFAVGARLEMESAVTEAAAPNGAIVVVPLVIVLMVRAVDEVPPQYLSTQHQFQSLHR